jgi:hypothetical protein
MTLEEIGETFHNFVSIVHVKSRKKAIRRLKHTSSKILKTWQDNKSKTGKSISPKVHYDSN